MTPYFSVVISLYNKETHIQSTIESVLAQTFTDFEIIVVNDGSTDGGEAVVKSIDDARIVYYSQENQGVSAARNFGIAKAKATLIAFLDADDYWYPNHLETLKALCEKFPGCGLYATAYEKSYFNTFTVKARFNELPDNFTGIVTDYFKHSIIDAIAWTSATAIPKTIFESHDMFDNNLKSGQDTDMWIRIAIKENVAFSSNITARRIITDSKNHLSSSKHRANRIILTEKFKTDEATNKSLKRYIDLNRFAIAIDRKMNGDNHSFKKIYRDIDLNNLSLKQKLALKIPKAVLQLLKKLQNHLIKNRVYLSVFR